MTSVSLQQLDNGDVYSSNGTAGNTTTTATINVTGCDSAEQITKLFPKCRPRADVNLNPLVVVRSTPIANEHDEINTLPTTTVLSSGDTPEPLINIQDVVEAMIGTNETDRSEQWTKSTEKHVQVQPEADIDDDNIDEIDDNDEGMQEDNGIPDESGQRPHEEFSSEDGELDNTDVIVLTNNKGGAYKMRDSRVIEIAGGREIYSQSRTKAARKSRYAGDFADKKKAVWDVRTRCNNDMTKHNSSREVTETVFSTEVCSVRHQRPSVHNTITYSKSSAPETILSPSRSMAVVSCGEVVVFDDIGDNWQGLRLDLCPENKQTCSQQQQQPQQTNKLELDGEREPSSREQSPNTSQSYHRTSTDFFKIVSSAADFDANSLSPEPNNKVAQMIGNLPIAVYEGSPRRYGPRQPEVNTTQSNHPTLPSAHSLLASPSVYPPRPGFPQRVVTTPSESEPQDVSTPTSEADNVHPVNSTFDYLYEFSETRKVLEEFFKCPPEDENTLLEETVFQDLDYELHRQSTAGDSGSSYVGQRLAKVRSDQNDYASHMDSPRKPSSEFPRLQDHEVLEHENNFLDLSVGTGSSGDLGETEVGLQVGHSRNFTLSPETTDCDSNCGDLDSEMSLMLMENELGPSSVGLLGSSGDLVAPTDSLRLYSSMPVLEDGLSSGHASDTDNNNPTVILMKRQITEIEREIIQRSHMNDNISSNSKLIENNSKENGSLDRSSPVEILIGNEPSTNSFQENETDLHNIDPLVSEVTPPPPAPAPHRRPSDTVLNEVEDGPPDRVEAAIQDIRLALQRTKTLPLSLTNAAPQLSPTEQNSSSPVWVPRQRGMSGASRDSDSVERKAQSGEEAGDEEEADTDLETDRLLGQHRTDDQGFYDDKLEKENKKKSRNKEGPHDPSVLIEGVLFRARYLGSTQLVCEGQPTKSTRMMQAEEAVSRIKAPDGESQPSTEVDLFISTEKIMVLNTDLKEIMMDHALRTISYIADIGDLVVLMARRRLVPHEMEDPPKINRTPKMICHVFESEEAQFIAQSIGQAFQVAYMEFLKANGIEDHSFVKEMDYQEVLNSQEIFGDELQMFAKKEMQKEVVVPKSKGEILGVVIVESGWGSMLPTVVIANLAPAGAAARCGQLNIGDQIIAINGVSLVGLPLSTCQNYIKNSKNQTVVKLTVVPCAPVVEVKIKRPDTKYQLGFSVQNGVICSLLRGGIAERGGVRVGHRIIEINNQSVVAVPHEKIVNLLATSVGEILMKTMPTSMFRLLTGQENPVYI